MKTTTVINTARGATLLVDEAYQLAPRESPRDFGIEAIETIMGVIEGSEFTSDDRPAFIFAGYPKEMDAFLAANSGLRRRVTDCFTFENYSHLELYLIFVCMATKSGFICEVQQDAAVENMISCFQPEVCEKHNAGISSRLFAESKCSINRRVLTTNIHAETGTLRTVLMTITHQDFLSACSHVQLKIC